MCHLVKHANSFKFILYTAAPNYSYMISNDAGHNHVFITENDCPGIDRENHR